MKSNTYFKDSALEALRGNWGNAVLTTLVVVLLVCMISGPAVYTTYRTQVLLESYSATSLSDVMELAQDPEIVAAAHQSRGASSLTTIIEIFLLLPLQVGLVNAFRKLLENGDTNLLSNTFRFTNYWRKVGGMLLMSILVFLWTLLLIVPGIIKLFSYAMTPYILDEYPELTASEAIHRSRMMMKGHKFDLFWLFLSFIGWSILCLFTCGIGYLWLYPYMQTAEAAFYREVKADYALHGGLD